MIRDGTQFCNNKQANAFCSQPGKEEIEVFLPVSVLILRQLLEMLVRYTMHTKKCTNAGKKLDMNLPTPLSPSTPRMMEKKRVFLSN